VNHFTIDEHEKYEPLRVDPSIGAAQKDRLVGLRAARDQAAVEAALRALRSAAQGSDNVLYPMRDALRAHATVGEVSDALRDVWGSYTPADTF
jgi:methylmalonyl-CoA mutase N-terminal domain/subunit